MRVRELDNHHDWTFGRGTANYITGSAAIAQSIKTALLALRGDWILNPDEGLPWFEFLDNNLSANQLERAIKEAVLAVEGVMQITDYDIQLDHSSRTFLIELSYVDSYNQPQEVKFHVANH